MPSNRYARVLESNLSAEAFVRASLGALEGGFREMALLALADWAAREIVSDELFSAVASLQRPSWGMWNGLLAALRNARKSTLRAGDAEQRQRLEAARVLEKVLGMTDLIVEPSVAASLKSLGELTRTSVGSKLEVGALLALPIGLRNRIAHDTPTDPAWWEGAAAALRPLVEFHAAGDPMRVRRLDGGWPSPWFLEDGGQVLSFNGVEHDFAVLYVNDAGVSKADPERTHEVLLSFQKLLGKVDEQEKEFKKILSKLAPEEIRGVMLGEYLVGRPVGEGGFATVHIGRQLSTGRKVAVKILHDGMEAEAIARFHQEAAFLSRFRHPNIVDVYGFGQETWSAPREFSLAGEPWFDAFAKTAPVKVFIALEWIEGRTLDDIFRESAKDAGKKPSLEILARWMAASADALSAVHAAGLIHRDVKPLNLMVTADPAGGGGQIKLMDFGIARVLKAERTLVTESGRAMGTPAYMSPEQIRAADSEGEVGPASDVYSLCATFYELVTTRRLFDHDTATLEEVKTMKATGRRPARPKVVVGGLPWEVETILLGGLEPEPADRYRTMDALERDLRHFLADEPIEYKRPSLARRALLVYRRNRAISNLAGAFVLLAVLGVTQYVHSLREAERRTAKQRDLAVLNEKIAREQTARADAREKDSRLRLAELSSNNGHQLVGRSDPAAALLWYVRSLPLVADSPERNLAERRRIGVTLRQMPRPVAMWNYALAPRQVVFVAALSPDGSRVATGEAWLKKGDTLATAGGGMRVLDSATGKEIFPPIDHGKIVQRALFSRDGKRIVTQSDAGVRVFDAATGKALLSVPPGAEGIGQGKLSSDGGLLLVCDGPGKRLRLLEVPGGKPLFPDISLAATLGYSEFSDDGKRFFASEHAGEPRGDHTIRVYDTATGKPVSPPLSVPGVWNVLFSPGGKTFAVASADGWARVYDSTTGQPVTGPLAHSGGVLQVAFSKDGKQLATGSADKTARIWDSTTGKALTAPMKHEESPFAMGFNDDGSRLITLGYDKALRVWDAQSGWPLTPAVRQPTEIQDANFAPAKPNELVVVTQSGAVWWDCSHSTEPGVLRVAQADATIGSISADGSRVALNASKGGVRLLDAADGALLATLPHPQAVAVARFSPDGKRIVTAAKDGARIWDLEFVGPAPRTTSPSTSPLARGAVGGADPVGLKHEGAVNSASFSPDGKTVLTASADKTARLWDATGKPIGAPMTHKADVTDAAFSPDGKYVATGSADQTSRVWDAATGAPLTEPLGSGTGIAQVRFSPDGKWLAAPDDRGFVKVWDWRAGTVAARMKYGTSAREASFAPDGSKVLVAGYNDAAALFDVKSPDRPAVVFNGGPFCSIGRFCPDGSMVYTAGFNGSRLWDPTGSPLGPILHPAPMRDGRFSPDGKWLLTVDTKVRRWDVSPDERPAAELEKIARLLSSRALDEKGVTSLITAEEATGLFEALRVRYPSEFAARR